MALNSISLGLHKVMQICEAATHHREHCYEPCGVQLGMLRMIAIDLRNTLTDDLEFALADQAIADVDWI